MRPKPILSVLLALAISGGLLWAFPSEWMALLLVLLGLLGAQAVVIRRSLTVMRANPGAPPLRVSRAAGSALPQSAFTNQSGTSAKPALDPAAFARFRAHLETEEKRRGLTPAGAGQAHAAGGTAAAVHGAFALGASATAAAPPSVSGDRPGTGPGEPLGGEPVTDHVALSSSARAAAPHTAPRAAFPGVAPSPARGKSPATYGPQRRVVMPGAKAKPPPRLPAPADAVPGEDFAREPEEVDLFADLRPTKAGTLPARPPLPPAADAVADAFEAAPPEAAPAEEAASLLKLAQETFQRGDRAAARAALDQHLSVVEAGAAHWSAWQLRARVCALDQEPQAALDAFEAMLKAGYALQESGVPVLIDAMLDGVAPDSADGLRVSLLLKVLAAFRQGGNRPAMDQVYRLLTEAQERVGDERKLVQFLKNHLEIKKVMGEAAGQLELIDQIGNRLFKLGETAEAREYYELGLKLRAEAQQAEAAQAEKAGTTPQPA
jgi:tetratricopeptide (TPR) repeat protein